MNESATKSSNVIQGQEVEPIVICLLYWHTIVHSFERAAEWNNWTDSERLLQLAGNLRGKAWQEFSLLSNDEKATFSNAIVAMRGRLDAGNCALAAQDFKHATQGSQKQYLIT